MLKIFFFLLALLVCTTPSSSYLLSPLRNEIPLKRAITDRSPSTTRLNGLFDDVAKGFQDFGKRFTQKASASHILIKGPDARTKLEKLLPSVTPENFSDMAAKYSACPSAQRGGGLGSFGPGQMVKEFDRVVFNDAVGVIHGPVDTQFGSHLILITERTE